MFNWPFLESVICMVFVFAMFSALASLLQELQSQYFGLRADILVRAIRRMLTEEKKTGRSANVWTEIVRFAARGTALFTFPISFPVVRRHNLKADAVAEGDLASAFFKNSLEPVSKRACS